MVFLAIVSFVKRDKALIFPALATFLLKESSIITCFKIPVNWFIFSFSKIKKLLYMMLKM